jgi:hypothetical protein
MVGKKIGVSPRGARHRIRDAYASGRGGNPEAVTYRVVEPRAVMKGYLQRAQFHTVYNRECAASRNDLMITDKTLRLQGEF